MKRTPTLTATGLAAALIAAPAHASFLPPALLDTAADWLALFVLFVVPIGAIILFWLVHVLPEKIAEKRHHPQKEGITTLCLLSLAFGGLLWPIAWIWAYTKPVAYKAAYGTDKHDDYFVEMADKVRAGKALRDELRHLRGELEAMEARGQLPPRLAALKEELDRLRAEQAAIVAPQDGKQGVA